MTQGQFLSGVSQVWIQSFPSPTSCVAKAEEPSLSYYLPGGRIIGFIPFPRVLVLCEMQSVSSRIWTRVAVSMSYDDNHYITGTVQRFKHYNIMTPPPKFNRVPNVWIDLCCFMIQHILLIHTGLCICRTSHRPDECGTRPYIMDSSVDHDEWS